MGTNGSYMGKMVLYRVNKEPSMYVHKSLFSIDVVANVYKIIVKYFYLCRCACWCVSA